MNIRKIVNERFRKQLGGVDLAADVNAVIAANVGEEGQTTRVSSRQEASAGSSAPNQRVLPFEKEKSVRRKEER
jgi:hypothetical protein